MESLSFENLLSADQIQITDIHQLIKWADEYDQRRKQDHQIDDLEGKILATLFFEPSTRTRFSFESAMYRLKGQVISLEQGMSSSAKKGESLADMGQIMSQYADIIAIRHPKSGSVSEFASQATVPIINAGDGPNQHPTQSLVDLYTIYREKKRITDLKIGFVGDLKYGRTVHSLIKILKQLSISFYFISHQSLKMPETLKEELTAANCKWEESTQLKSVLSTLDVLYVTRVQEERFESKESYKQVKDHFILKADDVKHLENLIVLHPLPRVNEIDPQIDQLPCAKYFKQIEYSLSLRMALIAGMLRRNGVYA